MTTQAVTSSQKIVHTLYSVRVYETDWNFIPFPGADPVFDKDFESLEAAKKAFFEQMQKEGFRLGTITKYTYAFEGDPEIPLTANVYWCLKNLELVDEKEDKVYELRTIDGRGI